MDIKKVIESAGNNLHTIIAKARDEDGSVETREIEPYHYLFKSGHEFLFCYDIGKQGTRSFVVARLISVEETTRTFTPRWPVEVQVHFQHFYRSISPGSERVRLD